jgi:hypothetical protein
MMTHIHGSDRIQMLLLPEAVDDYVSADNPVLNDTGGAGGVNQP